MMLYDALFALNCDLQVKPQMVDTWTISCSTAGAGLDARTTWVYSTLVV